MLEGLEIREVNFKEIYDTELLRIEPEFYTSTTFTLDKYFKGQQIIDFVQYGTSEELNEDGLGYPVLRLNEFDSYFIGNPSKYCYKINYETFQSLKLNKGDVLICRTNGNPKLVGKSALVSENVEYAYASYLFKIRPDLEKISSATLVAFLNGKYGRMEIEKYSMQGNQSNFSPAKFREIRIPHLSKDINLNINSLFENSFLNKTTSQSKYSEAEILLLETLGLQDFQPSTEAINVKSFKESFATTGRLDAEYYQPKYEGYRFAIENKNHTFIKNEYIQVKDVVERDLEEYNYIEIGDVNVGDGMSVPHKVLLEDLPANGKLKAKKGDLLISKVRPYRGAVSIVDNDYENLVVSGAFTVLRSNGNSKYNNEVLKVLLRSTLYKDWLLQFNVGTSYPVIKDEDILNLPIPFIEEELQEQIATLIQESFALKVQSEHLLEVAKRAVEIAIEENEEIAMDYINQNTF